jgi:hypothetical protein
MDYSQQNANFLNSIKADTKSKLLSKIAAKYGISTSDAYLKVTTKGSDSVLTVIGWPD